MYYFYITRSILLGNIQRWKARQVMNETIQGRPINARAPAVFTSTSKSKHDPATNKIFTATLTPRYSTCFFFKVILALFSD